MLNQCQFIGRHRKSWHSRIAKSEYTQEAIAEIVGMKPYQLNKKINPSLNKNLTFEPALAGAEVFENMSMTAKHLQHAISRMAQASMDK